MDVRSIALLAIATIAQAAAPQDRDPIRIQREIDDRAILIFARTMAAGMPKEPYADCDFDRVRNLARNLADAAENATDDKSRQAIEAVAEAYRDIPNCAVASDNNAGAAAMIPSYRTATREVLEAHYRRPFAGR